MKFQIRVHRHDTSDPLVFAQSRDEAIERLRKGLAPGWQISGDVVELGEGDEAVAEHVYAGECEGCSRHLWDEADKDTYVETDDGKFCLTCVEKMQEAGSLGEAE